MKIQLQNKRNFYEHSTEYNPSKLKKNNDRVRFSVFFVAMATNVIKISPSTKLVDKGD